MGSCLSKKKDSSSFSVAISIPEKSSTMTMNSKKLDNGTQNVLLLSKQESKRKDEEAKQEDGLVKKEIFVIKHRKSHDKRSVIPQNEEAAVGTAAAAAAAAAAVNLEEADKKENGNGNSIPNGVVRTSSCTKEEVDAILIQCGRLSRSNSSGKTASSARKYSGSKRSYDFDHDNEREPDGGDDNSSGDVKKKSSGDDDPDQTQRQHRPRHRQSSRQQSPASSSQGRRRTPSREREQQQSQQRSGSRERVSGSSGSGGRRVSRSPGRRSETNQVNATNANANSNRPGKMVSVPASVTSMAMDKSNNISCLAEPATATNVSAIKRISVKRNAGEAVGSRTAASPRSQSPARTNATNNGKNSNENQQQQPCLSRNSSRKAEHSPYRRNPLSEIDPNSLAYPQSACNNKTSGANNNRVYNKSREAEGEGVIYQAQIQKPNVEIAPQGTNAKTSSRSTLNNKIGGTNIIEREHQQQILEEAKTQLPVTGNAIVAESQKPQSLTRSRSLRRSRDLDFNPETLLNPTPSYTALLLEDIQNFHQKNTPSVSLPACVSKAHSILEAVADLNSTTSSNLSCAYSDDQSNNKNAYNFSAGINLVGKKMTEAKDPFVESEVFATDDLMEPSFHKYVTVRRGGGALGGADLDEQESSGSNSFVGGVNQQNWNFSSSSWEPNSADSTDRWTSRSNTKEEDQRHALPESDRKGFTGKKRDADYQQGGNWRGRVPVVAAAGST